MVFNLEVDDDSRALLDESAISDEINTTVKKEEGTILFKMPGKNDLSIQEEECV